MRYFIIFILCVFCATYYVLNRPYNKIHTGIILDKSINTPTMTVKKKHSDYIEMYSLGQEYIFLVKWEEGFNSLIYVDESTYNFYEIDNLIQINYDIYKNRNIIILITVIGIILIGLLIYIGYKSNTLLIKK